MEIFENDNADTHVPPCQSKQTSLVLTFPLLTSISSVFSIPKATFGLQANLFLTSDLLSQNVHSYLQVIRPDLCFQTAPTYLHRLLW